MDLEQSLAAAEEKYRLEIKQSRKDRAKSLLLLISGVGLYSFYGNKTPGNDFLVGALFGLPYLMSLIKHDMTKSEYEQVKRHY